MSEVGPWLAVIGALLGGGGLVGWATRGDQKSDAFSTQLQKRIDAQDKKIESLETRGTAQQREIDGLRSRELTVRNFVYRLIEHIQHITGPEDPPMPEMPEDLFS